MPEIIHSSLSHCLSAYKNLPLRTAPQSPLPAARWVAARLGSRLIKPIRSSDLLFKFCPLTASWSLGLNLPQALFRGVVEALSAHWLGRGPRSRGDMGPDQGALKHSVNCDVVLQMGRGVTEENSAEIWHNRICFR